MDLCFSQLLMGFSSLTTAGSSLDHTFQVFDRAALQRKHGLGSSGTEVRSLSSSYVPS